MWYEICEAKCAWPYTFKLAYVAAGEVYLAPTGMRLINPSPLMRDQNRQWLKDFWTGLFGFH